LSFSPHMDNFNKYLKDGEVLGQEIKLKKSPLVAYFILFLILGMFFLMFPVWKSGEAAITLWLFVLILLFFSLARQILSAHDRYLLTNQRIIGIRKINKDTFKIVGSIKLSELSGIKKIGNNDLCIYINNIKKIHLSKLQQRDYLYAKLENHLKAKSYLNK